MKAKNEIIYNPKHTLELLWDSYNNTYKANKYGPKASLSVNKIVETAVNLADKEGINALTVRNIASILKISPMSVYTYILNKNELITLMIDKVYLENNKEIIKYENWINGVRIIAQDNMNMFLNHNWLIDVYSERPTLGPGSLLKYERELSIFENLGLTDIEIDSCLNHLLNFIRTSVTDIINYKKMIVESELSNNEWWEANERHISNIIPKNKFPISERVGSSVGEFYQGAYNTDFAYNFGLNLIIESFQQLILSSKKK